MEFPESHVFVYYGTSIFMCFICFVFVPGSLLVLSTLTLILERNDCEKICLWKVDFYCVKITWDSCWLQLKHMQTNKQAEHLLCLINEGMLSWFYGCFDV